MTLTYERNLDMIKLMSNIYDIYVSGHFILTLLSRTHRRTHTTNQLLYAATKWSVINQNNFGVWQSTGGLDIMIAADVTWLMLIQTFANALTNDVIDEAGWQNDNSVTLGRK